ncbi:MAG: DUF1194 domain-containing protein [Geminicoccaceae bacterium]
MRAWAFAILLSSALVGPARSQGDVDLALVLAIDSSGSVEFAEFELQAGGIARAFRDPEVIEAIEGAAPNGIAVAVIQWSGRRQHLMVVDWTKVTDAVSAKALAAAIEATGRTLIGETAIADALRFATEQLARGPFQGARRVIDLSGDGPTNAGGDPDPVRDAAVRAGITINALAILNENPSLDLYYAEHVIGGPGAFIVTARDYADFAHAIRLKLLREIRGAPLAEAERGNLRAAGRLLPRSHSPGPGGRGRYGRASSPCAVADAGAREATWSRYQR